MICLLPADLPSEFVVHVVNFTSQFLTFANHISLVIRQSLIFLNNCKCVNQSVLNESRVHLVKFDYCIEIALFYCLLIVVGLLALCHCF